MDSLKPDTTATSERSERNDFMFYESYKDMVDMVRKKSPEAAGALCMAIIRLGVRREWTEDLPPEQKAFLRSVEPLMKRSKEKKEQKVKEAAREKYGKFKKKKAASEVPADQDKSSKGSGTHDPTP